MSMLSKEVRAKLAKQVRSLRALERKYAMLDPKMNTKRNRPAFLYLEHLQGLAGMLDYVRCLPSPVVVDLGAGTTRAAAELARSSFGLGIEWRGTGLVWDPAVREHLGRFAYRMTPAERMRGFGSSSVAGMLSVYGPFEYSNFLPEIFTRVDEVLMPGGVIKLCVMKHVPHWRSSSSEDQEKNVIANTWHAERCAVVEQQFRLLGYDLAACDHDVQNPPRGIFRTFPGENRIFLGVKPQPQGEIQSPGLAQRLMDEDTAKVAEMKSFFVEPC